MGEANYGIDPNVASRIALDIAEIQSMGVETAIVIGGGNIFRGVAASARRMDRATADYMGMLATVITPRPCGRARTTGRRHPRGHRDRDARRRRAVHPPAGHPSPRKGRVVVFSAGTGNPFFSTDTAAALRAAEIKAEVIFKATKVDGIYDADDDQPDAVGSSGFCGLQVLEQRLNVMDATAILAAWTTGCQSSSSICAHSSIKRAVIRGNSVARW